MDTKVQPIPEKKKWHAPEIVTVGGTTVLTTGPGGNVGDTGTNPRTYSRNRAPNPTDRVDLKGR
jgi:hypothetical protein